MYIFFALRFSSSLVGIRFWFSRFICQASKLKWQNNKLRFVKCQFIDIYVSISTLHYSKISIFYFIKYKNFVWMDASYGILDYNWYSEWLFSCEMAHINNSLSFFFFMKTQKMTFLSKSLIISAVITPRCIRVKPQIYSLHLILNLSPNFFIDCITCEICI